MRSYRDCRCRRTHPETFASHRSRPHKTRNFIGFGPKNLCNNVFKINIFKLEWGDGVMERWGNGRLKPQKTCSTLGIRFIRQLKQSEDLSQPPDVRRSAERTRSAMSEAP